MEHVNKYVCRDEDRLSSLPECILINILSLLPICLAAATSVLSKRWRGLWTKLDVLNFSWKELPRVRSHKLSIKFDFFTTVDHILGQITAPRINRFNLFFTGLGLMRDEEKQSCSYVESWVRQICSRSPLMIKVKIDAYWDDVPLPICIFNCQSLECLSLLGSRFVYMLPDNGTINLPKLKKLRIGLVDPIHKATELMNIVFKSCLLLEVLELDMFCGEEGDTFDLCCSHLKSLTIKLSDEPIKFMIDTPELQCFSISGSDSSSSLIHFVKSPSALIETTLALDDDGGLSDNLCELVELARQISATRSLHVQDYLFIDAIADPYDKVLPVFPNLTKLNVETRLPLKCNSLLLSLYCAPNLKILTISKVHDEDEKTEVYDEDEKSVPATAPECLLNKLVRIEIKDMVRHFGAYDEKQHYESAEEPTPGWFLEYIVNNANVLQYLYVGIQGLELCDEEYGDGDEDENEVVFCKKLFKTSRISQTCQIDVVSRGSLKASSKNFNDGSPDMEFEFVD